MSGHDGALLPPGGTLRPVRSLADDLAPGGRYEKVGAALRYYDSEIAQLRAEGVPSLALAMFEGARWRLIEVIARLDAAEPRVYVYEPPTVEG